MSPVQPVRYTSRDGLEIHGYLTLPAGRAPRGLPCIINPHGGPWARDAWGYNPEIQFLANRGFCVLQMNFRGSTGYGRRFWEASRSEEHTSELQSLMRISYAVFCLKKKRIAHKR